MTGEGMKMDKDYLLNQQRLTELSAGSLTMTAAGEEFLPGPREEAN